MISSWNIHHWDIWNPKRLFLNSRITPIKGGIRPLITVFCPPQTQSDRKWAATISWAAFATDTQGKIAYTSTHKKGVLINQSPVWLQKISDRPSYFSLFSSIGFCGPFSSSVSTLHKTCSVSRSVTSNLNSSSFKMKPKKVISSW